MIRKGIIINTSQFTIEKECEYDDTRVDGMWHRVGKDLIPIAYIFPIENKDKVINQLNILKEAKKNYDDLVAKVYYKVFPTLR